MRISALDKYTSDLRRAAITLAVVAAHFAPIIVMLRSAGQSADVVAITLLPLPISPEDRPPERASVRKFPISQASATASRRAAVAREPATEQRAKPLRGENETLGATVATHAPAAGERTPPIDWYAEIATGAHALERNDAIEKGWLSLTGPKQPVVSTAPQKPACPYEKCESGWGENLGIFKPSLHSKAGRIEAIPSDRTTLSDGSQNTARGESVLWINNYCYNILVSPDAQRQGMYKCFFPLGKTAAPRDDLFNQMDGSRPPQSHNTDAPWISYGLTFGAARNRNKAH